MELIKGQGGDKPKKIPPYEKEPSVVELDYIIVKRMAVLLRLLLRTSLSPNNEKLVTDLSADIKTACVIASEKTNNPKIMDAINAVKADIDKKKN